MNYIYKLVLLNALFFLLFTITTLPAQNLKNVQIRGDVQIDGRAFINDDRDSAVNTYLIRRARISVQGSINDYFSFRIMPNFGGGNPDLQDAYIDFTPVSFLTLRAGKFKPPIGLERSQSPTNLMLPELALPTNLVPLRDTGILLTGRFGKGFLRIEAGLLNGTLDGTSINSDYQNPKDIVGRVFIHPLIKSGNEFVKGLGVGIAGTRGTQNGTVGSPRLPSYSSGGRQTIFRYRSYGTAEGTAIANGAQTRIVPQLYHYAGPLGIMFEYAASSHSVIAGNQSEKLTHSAWNIQSSFLLTGEKKSFGAVVPDKPLGNGFGALEIAARYGSLSIDNKTFPTFSDPNRFAEQINAWAIGLNWYPTEGSRFSISYEQTDFESAISAFNMKPEKVLIARLQVVY